MIAGSHPGFTTLNRRCKAEERFLIAALMKLDRHFASDLISMTPDLERNRTQPGAVSDGQQGGSCQQSTLRPSSSHPLPILTPNKLKFSVRTET
jgi:hypothetical protein